MTYCLLNKFKVSSGYLRRVSTDELSKCSGECATTLGEEVDLPNTPRGPGPVAAISAINALAKHTDTAQTQPSLHFNLGGEFLRQKSFHQLPTQTLTIPILSSPFKPGLNAQTVLGGQIRGHTHTHTHT